MLTQCPKCETYFRLSAPQLRAARGMVRCGECDALFNALDYLHEHIPPPTPASLERTVPDAQRDNDSEADDEVIVSGTEAEADTEIKATENEDDSDALEPITVDNFINEEDDDASSEADQDLASNEPETEPGPEAEPEQEQLPLQEEVEELVIELPVADEDIELQVEKTDPMDILIEPPSSSAENVIPRKIDLDDIEDLPSELRDDEVAEPRRGVLAIVMWSLGIFVLIMALLVQLGISFQMELTQRFPQSRLLYDRLCQHLPCQPPVVARPEAVKLVARDVRHHPRFRDTLLVNGTLINESQQTVSYPVLQFELLDTTGTVIGVRQFQPAEYLDKSIDVDQGMPPQRPVHIVLEVLGASDSAVSFEFSFL